MALNTKEKIADALLELYPEELKREMLTRDLLIRFIDNLGTTGVQQFYYALNSWDKVYKLLLKAKSRFHKRSFGTATKYL